jgi:hypothetical protein
MAWGVMVATRVVNIKGRRAPGGAPPPGVTYIGHAMYRGGWRLAESRWANPYTIDTPRRRRDGTREEVVAKYRAYLLGQPELRAALPQLRGKVLGCWCTPLACHGDVLVELAEQEG